MRFIPIALAVAALATAGGVQAQSTQKFVTLGRLQAEVVLPDKGPAPHVGVIYENGQGSLGNLICTELAKRGFMALCSAERMGGGSWESVALDIKADIDYLRRQPGITKVILYGHSGGGAVASFYQATAENGLPFCQDKNKLSACHDDLANLPPADGVVFPDAHPGLAIMDLRMINPSITSDGRKLHVDPALDPFDPSNGFNPKGASHYSAAFQARYEAAQAAIMQRTITQAQDLKAAIKSGAVTDPTADSIVADRTTNFANHLDELDPDALGLMATEKPRRLLKNDGTIVVQPIRSVSVGNPDEVRMGPGLGRANVETSDQFLSRSAVRATDSVAAIEFCSSNSATVCNAGAIHVPVLFIAMGANTFIADEERMFERSPAKDKEYIVVEGALHGGQPCTRCEKTPGQYANSQTNMCDYIAGWINKRF
jgi:pimeloyl-ACP methyl ester carboxylesterase